MRGGGKGGKYTFSFSFFFQNQWVDFNLNSVGITLRGEGPKVVHVEHVASRGPRGRVPQGEITRTLCSKPKSITVKICYMWISL